MPPPTRPLPRAPRPLGQPEFDAIENQNQLREQVMRCEFGIARDRLEDSYASTKVKEDIEVRRRHQRRHRRLADPPCRGAGPPRAPGRSTGA